MQSIKILLLILLLVGCKREKIKNSATSPAVMKNGMLVLCEGLFQQNNSTISWVDFTSGGSDDLFFTNKISLL